MSKEVNYKWIPKKGWVVESEDETLKMVVEETLKKKFKQLNPSE